MTRLARKVSDAAGLVGLGLAYVALVAIFSAIAIGIPFGLVWLFVRVVRLAWTGE